MQTQTDADSTKGDNSASHTSKGDNSEASSGSFTAAFKEKYCCQNYEPQVAIIQFHSKVTTLHLKTVDLSMKEITHAGIPESGLSLVCPSIVDLDISHNQLVDWSEVLPLLHQLPHLEYLNLTNNPLQVDQEYLNQLEKPIKKLENLVLNRTNIQLRDVLKLSRVMPGLKELHLCDNGYRELLGLDDGDLPQVQCLRMNNNHIESWSEVWKLRNLPNLKSLILSGNPLQDCFYSDPCCHGNQGNIPACDQNSQVGNHGDISGENSDGDKEKNVLNVPEKSTCDKFSVDINCDRNEQTDLLYGSCDTHSSKVSDDVMEFCSNLVKEMLVSALRDSQAANQMTRNMEVTNDSTSINASETTNQMPQNNTERTNENTCLIASKSPNQMPQNKIERTNENTSRNASETTNRMPQNNTDNPSLNASETTNQMPHNNIKATNENTSVSASETTNQMPRNNVEATHDNTREDCRLDENQEPENESGFQEFIEEDSDVWRPFQSLHTICLTDTCLHHWHHLKALNQFPSLKSVRLKTTNLYSEASEADKRKLLIASLPNVVLFNGSEISSEEREEAERFYIRHYVDQTEKPDRAKELEGIHGKLSKIVDISIGWNTPLFPRVHFYVNDRKVFTEKIDVKQTIQKLRKYLSKKLDIMQRVMIIYHLPCGPTRKHVMGEEIPEKEEMCSFYLPLSRFGIHDDDEIHVQEMGTFP